MKLPVAILAGGLATRMGPLTANIPKSLLQVAGKPFAFHQLELLSRCGIDHVVFCAGHLGEQLASTIGDGSEWDMKIEYVFDGPTPLGTGGALKNALPQLGHAFLVLYGDVYLECDYAGIVNAFSESRKLGLLTVLHNANRWDKSNIVFSQGKIHRYDKVQRTSDMAHIDAGVAALRSDVLNDYPSNKPLDLAEIFQRLIAANEMLAFEVTTRFYEIGSTHGLKETQKYLTRGSKTTAHISREGP